MSTRCKRRPWVTPRPCCCAVARERTGVALRKAGRIAACATLLGLKLFRTVLEEGIGRLEKDLHAAEPEHKPFRRITIQ